MMEKEKALEMALSQIEKQFGKGAIMKLGYAAAKISVSTISTGCLALDLALGVGGIPRGRRPSPIVCPKQPIAYQASDPSGHHCPGRFWKFL